MYQFVNSKSFQRLSELAEECVDLTNDEVMTPKRLESMIAQNLGIKLFYGTEKVNDVTINALFDLAQEAGALDKMLAMQNGEVVNFIEGYESEQRSALHTAMRDFFDQRAPSDVAKGASKLAYDELEKLKDFLSDLDNKQTFTDMVQVGIGGSALGPKAIFHALEAYIKPGRALHFISNVDPDDGAAVFQKVDLSKTVFVIVSKSGTTLETLTNEAYIKSKLQEAGLDPKNHLISVTGKGSPMDDPSKYLASFYIWDYIGGRYSVSSMVGCVALAFALGMDRVVEFLRGMNAMDKVALRPNIHENLPLLSALLSIWNRNFLGYPTTAIIPYSAALHRFPAHLQQLEMESNGKGVDKYGENVHFDTGAIIWGEPGTDGQHSFFQLIHQGSTIIPVEFIGFRECQRKEDVVYNGTTCQEKLLSNLFAQSIALATGQKSDNPNKYFHGNRPNRIFYANTLNPFNLGALLAYYEHQTVFQGFIWNINSFDQEGVQLGKVLANQLIHQFSQLREKNELDPKSFPLGQAYLRNLD